MSRKNDTVDGVFTKLWSNYDGVISKRIPSVSKQTRDLEDTYACNNQELMSKIRQQALLEQLIMQRRVYENIKDIKLGFQDEYIFAMCPFYRGDKKANDVRVYPGKISIFGRDLESLQLNEEFMDRVTHMLRQKMAEHINQTEEQLNQHI